MISHTEENYLKIIYKLSEKYGKAASTNAISKEMKISAASVTDMLKRLSEKTLLNYEKYKGVTLTSSGNKIAKSLIRNHRLWEVFLVDKLSFRWDEVHNIAEELEHIKSKLLIERLDQYLGHPKFDPHGDPIPDADGNIIFRQQRLLIELQPNEAGAVLGVQEHSTPFLQYLDHLGISLGSQIQVLDKFEFDNSIKIRLNQKEELIISNKVSQNLYIGEWKK